MRVQVFLEDAGFDWKILGPDVRDLDYVAYQCDQDAYACSGQKCSATSLLMAHTNYFEAGESWVPCVFTFSTAADPWAAAYSTVWLSFCAGT